MLTVGELLRRTPPYLAERGVRSPRLDTEHLLAAVLSVSRLDLYLRFDQPVEPDEVDRFRELVRRRGQREPLAYLVGAWGFHGLDLACDPRALIPRPETELLVEQALATLAGSEAPAVLDVGTGSGAIALAVKAARADAHVTATDVSAPALTLAAENAERLGLTIELLDGDLFAPVEGRRFDLVIANPPYVADHEEVDPETAFEPQDALFAGPDGLAVLRRIADHAPSERLALEIGHAQAEAVSTLLVAAGFGDVRVERDLAGFDRVVIATRQIGEDGER